MKIFVEEVDDSKQEAELKDDIVVLGVRSAYHPPEGSWPGGVRHFVFWREKTQREKSQR